jgi:RNA-directed DNA polymerase
MSLTTPLSVQKLQTALHAKAKESPNFRFHALYDKVYRKDVLAYAYERCQANGGAAGVDDQTFENIEAYGRERWLDELTQELKSRTYQPQPVRRVYIPKPDGKQRPLGIPTVHANCTSCQFKFGLGGDPPSVSSASRPAVRSGQATSCSWH